jgi:hypothetical protein
MVPWPTADQAGMRATKLSLFRPRARRAKLTVTVLAAGLVLSAVPAEAATFGPDLEASTANYPYRCSETGLGGSQGCTMEDVLIGDTATLLPEPITNGDQTGVITTVHVKSATEASAMFVIVEWSGKPGAGEPFPSGVMAISEQVVLHPGINNFNTNLPVDRRFSSNGFESWSQLALTLLNGSSVIPAESGGPYSYTGTIWDNGQPLTHTVEDLTVPPHRGEVGGLPPATLLISGEITSTTNHPQPTKKEETPVKKEEKPNPPPPPPPPVPQLTVPGLGRITANNATLPIKCVGPANCLGTLLLQNLLSPGATLAKHSKSSKHSKSKKQRTMTYATGSFSISAGNTMSVVMKLTKAGRMAIKGHRSVKVYVNATITGGHPTSWKVTLRR